MPNSAAEAYDRLLSLVVECFDGEDNRKMIDLRADPEMQARIDELADKCNEGLLTPQEDEEYGAYVRGANLIAIMQAKAKKALAKRGASSNH